MASKARNDEANGVSQTTQQAPAAASDDQSTSYDVQEQDVADQIFSITVKLPNPPVEIKLNVSSTEPIQDVRASILEFPEAFQYSCFHLEHNGQRINDFVELSEIEGIGSESVLSVVEDPYTEKEARLHVQRIRDLVGATGDKLELHFGVSAGTSLLDSVAGASEIQNDGKEQESVSEAEEMVENYDFDAPASVASCIPEQIRPAPKTVKSLSVSPWNPPPLSLRQRGHLMYLLLTTLEGEQFFITSHVSGFFVNKSSNSKFDPVLKVAYSGASAHSLLTLIGNVSKSFNASFQELKNYNSSRDPLVNYPITNALPASPWVVSPEEAGIKSHQADICRTQDLWLNAGSETMDNLRDWNEEFQSTKELPKDQVQERVFRERVTNKLFADYTDAAVRGAILVARGELAPLNPTEQKDAQIFVHNNVFYSFGVDGMSTFATEGGDDAARVAVGRDVNGVKAVAQLDIDGLFTPGTVVVDYMGRRVVGQSIVPGIFKQREPDEHQIDYGGVEGRETVATNEAFVEPFSKLAKAMKMKRHGVWDKQGEKHTLETSVETKGLLGTDGRKYVLDLYRLTPLDITWLENYWVDSKPDEGKPKERNYPHRMAVLRQELIDDYWRLEVGKYVTVEYEKRKEAQKSKEAEANGKEGDEHESQQQEKIDISKFELAFNPDVFNGQLPTTDEDKEAFRNDEEQVRKLCAHLKEYTIPQLFKQLVNSDIGFPMDGSSLSRLLHKRGINIRYLGHITERASKEDPRLQTIVVLAIQEMIARSFKHIANHYLRNLPAVFVPACVSHLLNCLLDTASGRSPKAFVEREMQSLYPDVECVYAKVTPQTLKKEIESQVFLRYRYTLSDSWRTEIKHLQLLREVALKLGIQLQGRAYRFPGVEGGAETNGHLTAPDASAAKKKKGKKSPSLREASSSESLTSQVPSSQSIFEPDDIVNLVPVVKDSSPRSNLAEEALEAGRISLGQEQRQMGLELLFEGMSLHEQIYGVLHPEVARMYHTVSTLFYQLGEKSSALELAKKAVMVSERTLGLDSSETIMSYLNLSLFEHGLEHTDLALRYVGHALDLWKLAYGSISQHPDAITTINNAAVMLQALRKYGSSRRWFEKSHAIAKDLSGPNSVTVATLSFQLSQALALDQNSQGAVRMMQEARNIFKEQLGEDDRNTVEAQNWLKQLMQNHQNIAKAAKEQQARRMRLGLTRPAGIGGMGGATPGGAQGPLGTSDAVRQQQRVEDTRTVEELVNFIEGKGSSSSTSATPKKKTTTPAFRRGGRRT